MNRRAALILIAIAGLPIGAARAWGPEGHAVVADIAAAHLTAGARAAVGQLLALEPGATLASVSSWADDVRPNRKETAPLHFIDFQGACTYDAAAQCAGGNCLVGAIERYTEVVSDTRREPAERLEGLKFLVHFAGDIAQPLHAGARPDKGGNQFQVQYAGKGTNLHHVWDTPMVQALDRDAAHLASTLTTDPGRPVRFASDGDFAPARWAEESCRISETIYPEGHRIDDTYVAAHAPIVAQQLQRAGERLAAILNQALDPPQ